MKVFFHPVAAKEIKKLDKEIQGRAKKRCGELESNPGLGKKLVPSRFLSLRVGDYRAIYEIREEKIVVLFVGRRKHVYDEFNKMF